ncbi:MAG: FAD-dependent oxidoreductase [Xanthomonadales bacterium]|nr:FAD-dependent oxidoreductase [Xanthomonadales bacterium]
MADRAADVAPAQADVVIVGAGIVGLACAWHLLAAGREVLLVDAGAAAGGASHGNCGTITPSHAPPLAEPGLPWQVLRWMTRADAPFYLRPRWDPALWRWLLMALRRCNRDDFERTAQIRGALLLESRDRLAGLIDAAAIDCGYERRGTLCVMRTRAAFDSMAGHARLLERLGMPIEPLHGPALHALEPALNEDVRHGWLQPQDGHLRPDRLAAGLLAAVRARGAQVLEHLAVDEFLLEQGRIAGVVHAGGRTRAQAVVLAAGAWSPLLARRLGLRVPVQPGKGYSLTYDRPVRAPNIPLVLEERSVCVTAWADGYRLGSTMEFSGYDDRLNRLRLDALRRAAAEYLREPEGPHLREEWYGWRPMTPDDLPLVGPVRRHPGLWLATGHGMLGVSLAAVTGAIVADQVQGRVPAVHAAALSPERFG